jgi:hypothetical protein
MRKFDENHKCSRCGEKVVNGVGPSGMPAVTTILNKLPSSHAFYCDACQHDCDYHDQIGKEKADIDFLNNMKSTAFELFPVVERKHWYSWLNPMSAVDAARTSYRFSKRRALVAMAWRNYFFVKYFGGAAYREGACKKAVNHE